MQIRRHLKAGVEPAPVGAEKKGLGKNDTSNDTLEGFV